MSAFQPRRPEVVIGIVLLVISVAAAGSSLALAADSGPPMPNALAPSTNPLLGPVTGVDISGAGPASAIHGDPVAGATTFHAVCASCHGEKGATGIDNPGSDDGSVPVLNPIDPGFLAAANGDAGILALDIDRFVQHGSRPAGSKPLVSMPGFGDRKLFPQKSLADAEAYVMALNGVFWPDRCPGIQVELGNPAPGDFVPIGNLSVAGRAVDFSSPQGVGISRIDFFLDSRESGGRFLGSTTPSASGGSSDPAHFQTILSFPNTPGGHQLVAYATSSVTGKVGIISVPIALGQDPSKALLVVPPDAGTVSCTP
jgi:hypothetical protein